ncbi:MAG: hypothetical protein OHK0045_21870 [Raineya sp.]
MEYNELKTLFETIRNETTDKANTATRIGNAFLALLEETFLKGSDKSDSPTPPNINTFAQRLSNLLQFAWDKIEAGYQTRASMRLELEKAYFQALSNKLGDAANTQGELEQTGSFFSLEKEKFIANFLVKRFVDSELRDNYSKIESSINEFGEPSVFIKNFQGFWKDENDYGAEDIETILKISKDLQFYYNGDNVFTVNNEGVLGKELSKERLLLQNWIAPYSQIKTNVIQYDTANNQTFDLMFRNDTLFVPSNFASIINPVSIRKYEIGSTQLGSRITFIARLGAGKELSFAAETGNLYNIFPSEIPSQTSTSLKGIANIGGQTINILLEGKMIRDNACYWKVTKYDNII